MKNYHNLIIKNFIDEVKSGTDISSQFGVVSPEQQENIMVTPDFSDQTRRYFFDKAAEMAVLNNSVFSYLVTKVFYQNKELLVIASVSKENVFKETTIELVRDFHNRVSQLKKLHIKEVLLPEVEALI